MVGKGSRVPRVNTQLTGIVLNNMKKQEVKMIVDVEKIKELKGKSGWNAESVIFLIKTVGEDEAEKMIDSLKERNTLIAYFHYDFDTFVEVYKRWGVEKFKQYCNISVKEYSQYDVKEMLRYSDEILLKPDITYEDFVDILFAGISHADLIKRLNVAQLKVVAKWLKSQEGISLSKKRDLCREINMLLTEFPQQPIEKILKAIEFQNKVDKACGVCLSCSAVFFDERFEDVYNAYFKFIKELPSGTDKDNLRAFSQLIFKHLSAEQIVKILNWDVVEFINKWKVMKEDFEKLIKEQILGEFINSAESVEDFKETLKNWKSLNGVMTGEVRESKGNTSANKISYEQVIRGNYPKDVAEEIIHERILSIACYFSNGYEVPITAKIVKEFKKATDNGGINKNDLRKKYHALISDLKVNLQRSQVAYDIWTFVRENETEIANVCIAITAKKYPVDYAYWDPFIIMFKQTGDSEVFKIGLINLKTQEIKNPKDCAEILQKINLSLTIENLKCVSALKESDFTGDEIVAMWEYYKDAFDAR